MGKLEQVVVQEQASKRMPVHAEETRASGIELFLRKIGLAALTMLGIGYVLVNVPIAILIGYSVTTIPISSQANISAIAGRILFLLASMVSVVLGGLFVFGAVQFYEREETKGITLLGVLLGCFYLLCLGVGSTLLLSETSLAALMLTVAPILVAVSAATYVSPDMRFRLIGSVLGTVGGVFLAFAIFSLRILDLIFGWGIPFAGPFMSLAVLESAVVVLAPIAACIGSVFAERLEERNVAHVFVLLVALVYGIGAFVGSVVLSMSFWNLVWKSPWLGPFYGVPEWVMSTVVFWSASLVLVDIAGILLIVGACLGFIHVAREFSQL